MKKEKNPFFVQAIVHRIYYHMRQSPSLHSSDIAERKRLIKMRKAIIADLLGLTFFDPDGLRPDLQKKIEKLDPSLARFRAFAKRPDGREVMFASEKCSGELGKMRLLATDHVREYLLSDPVDPPADIENAKQLPDHIRQVVINQGLSPRAIELLLCALDEFNFRKDGYKYEFVLTFTKKARSDMDKNQSYYIRNSPNPSLRQIQTAKIVFPSSPEVRFSRRGIAIKQDVPKSVLTTMVGKNLSDIIAIPGLSDYPIKSVSNNRGTTYLKVEGL